MARGRKPARKTKAPPRTRGLAQRLAAALEQQAATAEILHAISRAQTDVGAVFDAIVSSAVRLLHAHSGILTRVVGDRLELRARTTTDASGEAALGVGFPMGLQSGLHALAIREQAPINVADTETDPRLQEAGRTDARGRGYR